MKGLPQLPMKQAALATYCVSCITMASVSVAALAVALGVAGAAPLPTPLDGFLTVWGLPLLLASLAALIWTMRRGPRGALALVVAGGALTGLGMLAMGTIAASGMSGMADHQASATGAISNAWLAVPFWVGAALLASGYVGAWRVSRKHVPRTAA